MGLASIHKQTKRVIEWQSGGTEDALRENARSAGFADTEISIVQLTAADMHASSAAETAARPRQPSLADVIDALIAKNTISAADITAAAAARTAR